MFAAVAASSAPHAAAAAPLNVSLSSLAVSGDVPPGTLVGTFSSSDPDPEDSHRFTLVGGEGSADNALFVLGGLDSEELRTAVDLSGRIGSTLSIRVRSTDLMGNWIEEVFAIRVTADSDGDGLDDSWELTFFPDLAAADGTGDPDGDGLNNAEEFARGTDPLRADTDGDGLSDAVETNSGTFVDASDTGSDPLRADTDGDGLTDGDEVSPENGFVTDPVRFDTDGDGYSDAFEISVGTDPLQASSKPDGNLPLRINEILASNGRGLQDGYGDRPDWVEIYNPNPVPVSLSGYGFTDAPEQLRKWVFPEVSVAAQGFLVVFASGRGGVDPGGHPHATFSLSAAGEMLVLSRPDGVIEDSYAYPQQFTDVSSGRLPSSGAWRFFATPTPGAANSTPSSEGVLTGPAFSPGRGFYDDPFPLILTTSAPGATIRYTLDGSVPTENSGLVYTSPIPISGTSIVRAAAFRSGWLSTPVVTHSYLFPDQVAQQPQAPEGFPETWGTDSEVNNNDGAGNGTVPALYEMDPRVDAAAQEGYRVRDALLDIPTLSLVLPREDFFGSPSGIYTKPLSRGTAWERRCSLELIHPDGSPGFQENCIVEVHGNSSRRPWRMHKHSLRITFRSSVGASRLDYNFFPDSPLDRWNKIVLRACFTDSWGLVSWDPGRYRPNDSQYIRDVWMKQSMGDMGHATTHSTFCHLYVDGLYWGLYNPAERIEARYFADRFGGEESTWELNSDFSTPGPIWNAARTATSWEQAKELVDMENFADYMLLHIFAGAEDWPHHNGYAAANPGLGFPMRFFVWDQEIVLDNLSMSRINSNEGAGVLFQKFRTFPEFRLLFADRAHRHLHNGGALSVESAGARYLAIASKIDKAIVAESARWGSTRAKLPYGTTIQQPVPLTNVNHQNYPPAPNGPVYLFTREDSWLVERDNVVNNYLPALHDRSRSTATVNRLRAAGLYPDVDAPSFSQFGGKVPSGFELSMSGAEGGTIYFTTDGSDPRAESGEPAGAAYSGPVTLEKTGTVKARVLQGGDWSPLTEAQFVVGTTASAANLIVTELNIEPPVDGEEFLELMNVSDGPVDFTGVHFTKGLGFRFPDGFVLEAGKRTVIVRDAAAFAARYGDQPFVAGQYTGALDNNGETLTLVDYDGAVIFSFRYETGGLWPDIQGGRTLVLTDPDSRPDPSLPGSWKASHAAGGTPGDSEGLFYNGGPPDGDDDHDGIPNLVDFVIPSLPEVTVSGDQCEVTCDRFSLVEGVVLTLQISTDLAVWLDAPAESMLPPEPLAPDRIRERWRFPATGRFHVRVRVTLQ